MKARSSPRYSAFMAAMASGASMRFQPQILRTCVQFFCSNVRVVVLVIRPAARELQAMLRAPVDAVAVDELRACVGIEAAQWEGQGGAHVLERRDDETLAFSKHHAGFRPRRSNVAEVDRTRKLPVAAFAAMHDGIGFAPAAALTFHRSEPMGTCGA